MLEVQLLGKFAAKLNGELLDIPSRPAQALLAYLILNAHKTYRRENLAGLLWPDSDETNARNNLRQTLWRLRKSVGEEFFLADKVSVGFNPQADYRLDADQLQANIDDTTSVETLMQMVAVYEDKLLPGFYDNWVTLEQERLQAIYEDRVQLLLARLVEAARWREAREWAERWIAQGLTPEPAYRALMTALAGLGDLSGVAVAYQRCTEALDEELGVEPSTDTQTLFQRLTTGEVVPPPQTPHPRSRPTVKLPLQPTPFIGRQNDLREIANLINNPSTRLVTILGPGGIGKTRLAIEAAQAHSDSFADGVYFVSLASVNAADQIAAPIATAVDFSFHIRDQRERWENDAENDQLLAYLCDKRILLILDNLEHLLAEIPFIADLLQSAGEIKILATSRERLGLRGETVYPISSLRVPVKISEDVPTIIDRHDAIQLFVNCAQRAQPTFELTVDHLDDVINICQLVDGMPLGIELAAAWVGVLTPQEIAAEIKSNLDFLTANWRDIPARHQSIRSVFESSWQRLTATEQDVFQQLSVFRGGFTRQAAEHITGATLPSLMTLANKSLIQPDYTGRYHIHELLRQFGDEHLAASTERETAVRDRHCAYYTAFLKQREPHLDGQDLHKTLTEISIEIDNIRRAWQWAITQQKLSAINDAMEGLCEYYRIRGFLREAYDFYPPDLEAMGWEGFDSPEALPDMDTLYNEVVTLLKNAKITPSDPLDHYQLRGKLLARYARLHCESPRNDWYACQSRRDAMHILSQTGDRREIAYLLRYLAHIGFTPPQTRHLYQQILPIFQEFDDTRGMGETLYRLGMIAAQLGNYNEAEQLYQESMANLQKLGRSDAIGVCLGELGYVYWALGDYQQAEVMYKEGLAISTTVGYHSLTAAIQINLARIEVALNNYQPAKQLLQNSLIKYREVGLRGMQADTLALLAHLAVMTNDFAEAQQLAEESLAICKKLDHCQGVAEPLTVLGEVCLGLGDFEQAEQYFHEAIKTAIEAWIPPYALHALVGLAQTLAAVGENARAYETATFILYHPASWQWSKDIISPVAADLEVELPSNVRVMTKTQAGEKNLEQVVEEFFNIVA